MEEPSSISRSPKDKRGRIWLPVLDVDEGVGHKDGKTKGFERFTGKRRPDSRAIQSFLGAEKKLELEWM